MIQHREIMKLVDNLHDLCCRGNKDYKMALENVQDYVLAKMLSRKCTVPHHTGDIKQAQIHFNILFGLQMDIELYNYVDILFRDFRAGHLDRHLNAKEGRKQNQKTFKNQRGVTIIIHSGVVFLPMHAAPAGVTLFRDNADFMNNFFVHIVATTFTGIEKVTAEYKEANNDDGLKETLKELEKVRSQWKKDLTQEVNFSLEKLDNNMENYKAVYMQRMGIKKLETKLSLSQVVDNVDDAYDDFMFQAITNTLNN
mmetsp:Transcript_8089/g.13582  ORF Transcript_8089/g.13582 Transcript_8089/m.13582 type:complete len:254 (+) Transcript_8089:1402-2163(+)